MKHWFAFDEAAGKCCYIFYICCMKINLLKNYDRFVILIWIALGINFFVQYSLYGILVEAFLASSCILVFAYPMTTYLSTTLLRRAIQKRKIKLFLLQFLLFSALTALFLLISGAIFAMLEIRGVFSGSDLFSSLNSPAQEVLNVVLVSCFINFGFCGLRFFEENMRLQQELTESQMEILKTQINPHFMFNVLNHIHVLMQQDVELASSLLLQYSDILRYQLYHAKEERVTIGQEIEFLKNYVEVEKLRWKGKLDVTTRWKMENRAFTLAPLLMITFIENAFKHVARLDSEKGYVDIEMIQKEKIVSLKVENSKSQLAVKNKKNSGIGLANIRKRLDILYPGRYELKVDETDQIYNLLFILKVN